MFGLEIMGLWLWYLTLRASTLLGDIANLTFQAGHLRPYSDTNDVRLNISFRKTEQIISHFLTSFWVKRQASCIRSFEQHSFPEFGLNFVLLKIYVVEKASWED